MAVCPPQVVDAPPLIFPKYGLFSAATVFTERDEDDSSPVPEEGGDDLTGRHFQCGVRYEPQACDIAQSDSTDCPQPVVAKEIPTGVELVEGTPFNVRHGFRCTLIGHITDAEERARQALIQGEQREVERIFWTGELGNTPSLENLDCTVLNIAEDPLNPTAEEAVTVQTGLGDLECFLGQNYGGTGVIHAPRSVAALASCCTLIEKDGDTARTPLGNAWAFGAGYCLANTSPGGYEAPDGTAWMYATGQVVIRRSRIHVTDLNHMLNLRTNIVQLLAERVYVITFECVCAATLVRIND